MDITARASVAADRTPSLDPNGIPQNDSGKYTIAENTVDSVIAHILAEICSGKCRG
jgi:hypothetical protein